MDPDLSWLLAPPNETRMGLGLERQVLDTLRGGRLLPSSSVIQRVRLYRDPFGSNRFVGFADRPIAGLQIMVGEKPRTPVVANVWTDPDWRGRGAAGDLYAVAKRVLGPIRHSTHLSESGARFAARNKAGSHLTETRADVLRLIAEGRHLGEYVPRYRPGARRGRQAFPVTIAIRAAEWLARHGFVRVTGASVLRGSNLEPTEAGLAELHAIDDRIATKNRAAPGRIGRREARGIVESARPASCRLISIMFRSHRDIIEGRSVEERVEVQCPVEELRNAFEQHPRAELTRRSDGAYNLYIGATWGHLNYLFET